MMKKAYRYRFYPTEPQKELLTKSFGCCRFVYNHFLDLKQKTWQEKKLGISYSECSMALTLLKREKEWLGEVSSVCLQQSLRHLQVAFEGFFKKRTQFPTFKRRDQNQACTFTKNAFIYREKTLALAKMGTLEVRWSRFFKGEPSSITVSKDSAGRYFVSLLVEGEISPRPFVRKEVGIDLGIAHMITDDRGEQIASPRFLEKSLRRLRRVQKNLSHKTKGSKNREKAKIHSGTLYAKIQDKRLDFLHKLSTQLINENQVIIAESLSVKKMLQSKGLARKIGDAGWGIFLRLLEYKCNWYGKTFVQIDQYFPSSKQCHVCQELKEDLKLQDREWQCSSCASVHDRDINAAKNILREGLRILSQGVPRGTRDLKPVELV